MRALITGAGGFAGSHLSEYLASATDWELFGVVRPRPATLPAGAGLDAAAQRSEPPEQRPSLDPAWAARCRLHGVEAELSSFDDTRALLADVRPDFVFHLAAQAIVQLALADPEATLVNNLAGQLNMLRGLRDLGLAARLLSIGSGEEYGHVGPEDLPVDEDTPFRPENAYAVGKIAADMLSLQYYITYRLPVVRVRPFNHIGPRQSENFVTAAFARQVARSEAGLQEPVLRVGNLTAQRDFTDVRDMVRAYHLAITDGEPGAVYNIGSGKGVAIQAILDAFVGMSRLPVRVEQDPARMRPSDVPVIVCDPRRFVERTGWQPTIPLRQSLADILDYWRDRAAAEAAAAPSAGGGRL